MAYKRKTPKAITFMETWESRRRFQQRSLEALESFLNLPMDYRSSTDPILSMGLQGMAVHALRLTGKLYTYEQEDVLAGMELIRELVETGVITLQPTNYLPLENQPILYQIVLPTNLFPQWRNIVRV